MALLLLTLDNMEYMKSSMRDVLPHAKPTHRTEALAAGFGFRSFASLLAALNVAAILPAARFFDPARFSERVLELSYDAVDPRPLIDIVRSSKVPLRPWTEFRNGDRAANLWFYECQRRSIPDIYIEMRTKYAKLNWDCISLDPKYDTHLGEDQGAHLVRTMFARFQALARASSGRAMFEGTSFVGKIDHLLPDVARDIADEFYMMLTAPLAQNIAA